MFDIFSSLFKAELEKVLPNVKEENWTTTVQTDKSFGIDKLIVTVATDGTLVIDVNGMTTLNIPPTLRHAFLEKIQKAVNMADVADPANEPLNKVLE